MHADSRIGAAILRRRHAEALLEGAIEGSDRAVAGLECDRQDRDATQLRIAEPLGSFLESMGMEEIVEVPEAEAVVDHPPQYMLLGAEQIGQLDDCQRFACIETLGHETLIQSIEDALLQPAERNRRRLVACGDP